MAQGQGLSRTPRLDRYSPGLDAGGQCSLRSGWPLALGKVRLICEGFRERSQFGVRMV